MSEIVHLSETLNTHIMNRIIKNLMIKIMNIINYSILCEN